VAATGAVTVTVSVSVAVSVTVTGTVAPSRYVIDDSQDGCRYPTQISHCVATDVGWAWAHLQNHSGRESETTKSDNPP